VFRQYAVDSIQTPCWNLPNFMGFGSATPALPDNSSKQIIFNGQSAEKFIQTNLDARLTLLKNSARTP
jgi:hypothetical protein